MSNRVYRNPSIKSDNSSLQSLKQSIGLDDLDDNLRSLLENFTQSTAKATSVNLDFSQAVDNIKDKIDWDELYSMLKNFSEGTIENLSNLASLGGLGGLINLIKKLGGGGNSFIRTRLVDMGSWSTIADSSTYKEQTSYLTKHYSIEWSYEDIYHLHSDEQFVMDFNIDGAYNTEFKVNTNNLIRKHTLHCNCFATGSTIEDGSLFTPVSTLEMPYNFKASTPSLYRVIDGGSRIENVHIAYADDLVNSEGKFIIRNDGIPSIRVYTSGNKNYFCLMNPSTLPAQVIFDYVRYELYDEYKDYSKIDYGHPDDTTTS